MISDRNVTRVTPWVMWTPMTLFFMYQFIVRVSLGVIQDDTMRRFGISAAEFGMLSSIFYIAYASMQLPVGLLLDRYGPRFVTSLVLGLIPTGILIFIYASNWKWALLGRILIGMGSAGGLLSTAKTTRIWFEDKMYAKLLSISISIGVMGAVYGNWPLTVMVGYLGWKEVLLVLVGVGLLLSAVIAMIIRNPKQQIDLEHQPLSIWEEIKDIRHHKSVVKLGVLGGMIGPFLYVYGDTFGASYLMTVHGFTKGEASGAISSLYLGLIVGMPLTVYFAEKINQEKMMTAVYGFATLGLFLVLLYVKGFSYGSMMLLHFVLGVLCAYQILLFALVVKEVSITESAFVTSIIQMLNMSFGFLGILLVGIAIDAHWEGVMGDDVRIYSEYAYQMGFSIVLIGLFLGSMGVIRLQTNTK